MKRLIAFLFTAMMAFIPVGETRVLSGGTSTAHAISVAIYDENGVLSDSWLGTPSDVPPTMTAQSGYTVRFYLTWYGRHVWDSYSETSPTPDGEEPTGLYFIAEGHPYAQGTTTDCFEYYVGATEPAKTTTTLYDGELGAFEVDIFVLP
jgi:hypothetical protein